eukprot:3132609-Rhodomonas_salina.1
MSGSDTCYDPTLFRLCCHAIPTRCPVPRYQVRVCCYQAMTMPGTEIGYDATMLLGGSGPREARWGVRVLDPRP